MLISPICRPRPPAIALAAALSAAVATAASAAPSVKAPATAVGDTWTYANSVEARGIRRTTHSTLTVVRVDGDTIGAETHVAGTLAPGRETLCGADWARRRSIDGRQTVFKKPLAFPLAPGRSWSFGFVDDAPPDRRHARERVSMTHRVAGWEEITVPAGTYRALRIDGKLTWTVELASNAPPSASLLLDGAEFPLTLQGSVRRYTGRTLTTSWYVPAVHRWVRSDASYFDADDQIVKRTGSVLEAFRLGDGAAGGRDSVGGSDAAPNEPAAAE